MIQKAKFISLGFIFSMLAFPAVAQRLFTADTTHRCIYSGIWFKEELYLFEPDSRTKTMLDDIQRAAGTSLPVELAGANVPHVAGIIAGDKYYLLYNADFFENNSTNPTLLYALLAHEMGHFSNHHKLEGEKSRLREESEADFFTGYTLRQISGIDKNRLLSAIATVPFSYKVSAEERIKIADKAWERADAWLKGKGNLSFYEDTKVNAGLPIARFDWPPLAPSAKQELDRAFFRGCATLALLNEKLCKALKNKGYEDRNYYYVPNGFAVVTQLEQFNRNGTSKAESRWADYPVQDNFGGLLDYLKALLLPASGHFRVFAFVVTDAPITMNTTRKVAKEEAAGWLNGGMDRLPLEIGRIPFSSNHKATVFVYEFEVSPSTGKPQQKKPGLLTAPVHMDKSGVQGELKK